MDVMKLVSNVASLRTLLASGRDVNVNNYRGESVLIESVKYNRVENVSTHVL